MLLSATSKSDADRYYNDNETHLRDELRKLDLLIARRVALLRAQRSTQQGMSAAKGIYISDAEVDRLLAEVEPPFGEFQVSSGFDDASVRLQKTIDDKLAGSAEQGVVLALPRLAALFGLSPVELQAVVICLAPELRRKYDTLYAYVQDDITRKRPSVDLVLDLTCASEEERWRRWALFSPQGTLVRQWILRAVEDPRSPSGSSGLACFLALDRRILDFLLGENTLDERLAGSVELARPSSSQELFAIDGAIRTGIVHLIRHYDSSAGFQSLTLYLYGPYGAGKRALALELCQQFQRPLLVLDLEMLRTREADATAALRVAFREGILHHAALYIEHVDALLEVEGDNVAWRTALAQCVKTFGGLTFLAGQRPWSAQGLFDTATFCTVEVPLPDVPQRQAVWTEALARLDAQADPVWACELADRFRLSPGQIRDATHRAAQLAVMRRGKPAITLADLYRAGSQVSHHKLGDLAARIKTHSSWEDLVLPINKVEQLKEICAQMAHRQRVFGEWGFHAKLLRGRGLSVLFCGASGTGKTMAAEVIAHEMRLDLYRIDLSGVVSKYIGETEKNLAKIFHEAEASNAILFFDEADALFGKRTQISDAHDRYANIETSYLLQRMEAYEGMAILATNLRDNMDEAFTRRIRFVVEFPFPDAACRQAIWQKHFPRDAPIDKDIDFEWLGRQFQITGGNIKNIVLNAAFLAAADGGVIAMEHVVRGARREFEKIGKLWDETFSHYPGA